MAKIELEPDKLISKKKILKLIKDIFYIEGHPFPLVNIYKIQRLEMEIKKL